MRKRMILALTLGYSTTLTFAQSAGTPSEETQLTPLDTLANSVIKQQSDLDILKRIKISGYLQPQFQVADSNGIASFAGGNFAPNMNKRFTVRRGRLKATYDNGFSQFVFQVDANEREIRTKDAYVKFTEPWARAFSLTIGITDFPFGYEVPVSSSSLEAPERGRMSQILMPGESDLGAYITFQPPKTSKYNFLKIDAGLFNGTSGKAAEFDSYKDFVGHIGINRSTKSEGISYGAGVSYYDGGWRSGTSRVYASSLDSLGLSAFLRDKDTANYGAITKRQYMGADFQVNIDWLIGITTLRFEYILGQQPGTSSTSTSPAAQPVDAAGKPVDAFLRKFDGAYIYFLQNMGNTKHELVVKYDWYDPNTDVVGDEIGKSITAQAGETFAKTNRQDIKYNTLGIGWIYRWDSNVRITAYYDMVTNETSKNLSGFTKDLKDNVFTLRVQYKF